jgi:cellulose synthase/poly-beta-1,6-N-acetylglucosamine synthase-like glycosyltransferase
MPIVAALAWWVYLAALAGLAVYGGQRVALAIRARRWQPNVDPNGASELPVVTVQLPIFNERAVADRIIAAALALDWPRDRFEIQVLDDSTDDTRDRCVAAVAAAHALGFDIVHVHRHLRTGWKAGALEAGRRRARGSLHAVFDADFVPPVDFLRRTVGYFVDPDVAMVQARWDHLNRTASTLTELQALLLDGHFAVEQQGRAAVGDCFNFNGTAGVWRAHAIADAGGWQADTLTEDLDLSYRAGLRGWKFCYAADVTAPAELPADMIAFKSQQFRWAKGSIECARKLAPAILRAPWSMRRRLEALLHLTHNLPYLLTLVVLLAGGAGLALDGAPRWAPMVHGAAAIVTASVFAVFVTVASGHRLRAVARLPLLLALTAGMSVAQSRAIVLGWLARPSEFVRTPKDGSIGAIRRPRRYRVGADRTIAVEVGLAVYLLACAFIGGRRGSYLAMAFTGWCALGVLAVAISSSLCDRKR